MAIRPHKPYAPVQAERGELLGLLIDYHALVIEFRTARPGSAEHHRLIAREQDLLRRIRHFVND